MLNNSEAQACLSRYKRLDLATSVSLILSSPEMIEFPKPVALEKNLLTSFTSLLQNKNKKSEVEVVKKIVPIPEQLILMLHGNSIRLLRYWQTSDQQVKTELHAEVKLSFYSREVKASPGSKLLRDKGFYFIAENSTSSMLELLEYVSGEKSIKKFQAQRIPSKILCWSFISKHEILLWCENMKIYHYEISETGLKQIQSIDSKINISKQSYKFPENWNQTLEREKMKKNQQYSESEVVFTLNNAAILGHRDVEQIKIIVLFYVLYDADKNVMKIKCKEIEYPIEIAECSGKMTNLFHFSQSQYPQLRVLPEDHEIISSNSASAEVLNAICLKEIDDAFLLGFESEIIVIQKKFDHYFVTDNIYKKNRLCSVLLASNSNIVTCMIEDVLEINEIVIGDPKVHSKMIDFIDLKAEKQWGEKLAKQMKNDSSKASSKLIQMWVSSDAFNLKIKSLFLVFNVYVPSSDGTITEYTQLFLSKKVPRVKKLTNLIKPTTNQEEITQIQQLGEALGVTETEFYFNLWKSSKQTIDDIFNSLLKCKNYDMIIEEIKNYLRRKTMAMAKLLKILKIMVKVALDQIKVKLTEAALIHYYEISFIYRKFTVYSSDYEIDERELTKNINNSIYDMVYQIIDKVIYPEVKESSPWVTEQKQPPKINLIHVLDAFKLPLLEDYEHFLRQVMMHYENKIVNVISQFPELVPNYPLMRADLTNMSLSMVTSQMLNVAGHKQIQFFSDIHPAAFKRENSFMDFTFRELYPHYPTSEINKYLELILSHPDIKDKKFYSHMIISSNLETYNKNIRKITDKSLYIVLLQCLILGARKRNQNAYIHGLLESLRLRNYLSSEESHKLQIASQLYELMLAHSIIGPCVKLEYVVNSSIEKWIALFFLGNKQQKDLIFHEFMEIYTDREQFASALKSYVISEHCSKIELTILIDLISKMSKYFQKTHQNIIEVIIYGFCSRIELCDTPDANYFIERIRYVQLGPELLLKVDKIQKMKTYSKIYENFSMERMTLQTVLDDTIKMLEQILQKFFKGEMKKTHILIEKKKVLIVEDCQGMFKLFHYLRENIFFEIDGEQLIISFCKKLIEWQQFDQVKYLLYETEYVELYDLQINKLVFNIQYAVIEKLYEDDELLYDAETKDYILKILEIDKNSVENLLVIHEQAKLGLVELFETWGFTIRMTNLNIMCEEWEIYDDEAKRQDKLGGVYSRPIMIEIIESYAEYLDLKSLQQIYRCFMCISEDTRYFESKTKQFYHYCSKLAEALMKIERYRSASEIICIVNEQFNMNYEIMSECLLKSLLEIYKMPQKKMKRKEMQNSSRIDFEGYESDDESQPKSISELEVFKEKANDKSIKMEEPWEIAKRYIDYFVINWFSQNEGKLDKIFSNYFQDSLENHEEEFIHIDPELCFKHHRHKLPTDWLWKLIVECQSENHEYLAYGNVYYGYFFMSMGLTNPNSGFSLLDYLSYNHGSLIDILRKFKDKCDRDESLFSIDYSIIFKIYLDSITRLLLFKQKVDFEEEQTLAQMQSVTDAILNNKQSENLGPSTNANLDYVRELVKKGEYKNYPLSNIINKMSAMYTDALKSIKKRETQYIIHIHQPNFDIKQNMKKAQVKNKNEGSELFAIPQIKNVFEEVVDKEKATLSYDDFKGVSEKMKSNKKISDFRANNTEVTERVMLSKILDLTVGCENEGKNKNNQSMNNSVSNILMDISPRFDELTELIAGSIKQLQEGKKKNEMPVIDYRSEREKEKGSAVNRSLSLHSKLHDQKTFYKKDEGLLLMIQMEDYSKIKCWSTDAILIEAKRIYHLEEISFVKVINMFHELCVGHHNKVEVIWAAEPENLIIPNEAAKRLFQIEYLNEDFEQWEIYQRKTSNKIKEIIHSLQVLEIKSLSLFLNEISKIQYRKVTKHDWLNSIATMGLEQLAVNPRSETEALLRLTELVALFEKEYAQANYHFIIDLFDREDCVELKKCLQQLMEIPTIPKSLRHLEKATSF